MLFPSPSRTPFAAAWLAVAACRPTPSTNPRPIESATTQPTLLPILPPPSGSGTPLTSGARIEDERNTISVFRDAAASTVFVTQKRLVVTDFWGSTEEVPAGSGSGFVWDNKGHIVTNFHVVNGAESLTVTFYNQQTFDARIVGLEPRKDVAVLKVDAPASILKPVRVPRQMSLEVGQKTIAIGNPFGLDHTLTTGVVSALGRQVVGAGGVTIRDMVQTDAAINPGNSGGPLLDSAGELIGMNTMIFSKSGTSAGIGFAVPVSTIARVAAQIIRSGKAEQVGFGIQIDPDQRIERRVGVKGVIVLGTTRGTPAEKGGLRGLRRTPLGLSLGDVVVGIDSAKVDDYDDLYNALDGRKPGDRVQVRVRRGDEVVVVPLELILLK